MSSQASDRLAIPFQDVGGLIVISAKVNDGPEGKFVLDTGAGPCVITTSVVKAQGLSEAEPVSGKGGAGTFSARRLKDVRLSVAGRRIGCTDVWETDLTGVSETVGAAIDGVVGAGFFAGNVVTIDYRHDSVLAVARRRYVSSGRGQRLPITIIRGRPHVRVGLRVGAGPLVERNLLIDTGSQDVVDDSLLGASAGRNSRVRTSGLGRGNATTTGTFSEVRLGNLVLKNIPGVVPQVPIIGAGLLSRFRVTLDYEGGWIRLEPST